jgi:3',5'-cyclic AMP phosphodiesterase CpdA
MMRRRLGPVLWLLAAACVVPSGVPSCSAKQPDPPRAPRSGFVDATDKATIVPDHPRVPRADPRKPSDPKSLDAMLGEGWGKFARGPGEDLVDRTPDGSAAPTPGPHRQLVARFVHTADFQLADDESPARVVALDTPVLTDGAFRPQESYGCRTLDSVVRTINKIHGGAALDAVVFGGDNVDNAQQNELDWVLSVFNGGVPLRCDSGGIDDPVPGPDNDGKDVFTPEGLRPPWLWVTGNHDVLNQGNFPTSDAKNSDAIGDYSSGGTRVYGTTGANAAVVQGTVVADPKRALMKRKDMVARVMNDPGKSTPRGHGLGTYAQTTGKAFFTWDIPETQVRFLVVDTSAETGGADGVVHRADVDAFVVPELARAKREGKWLVVTSHHAADRITDGADVGGVQQADALTSAEWEKLLSSSPQVILDLVGHAHGHRIRRLGKPPTGLWEMQCAAIADWPHQFRLLEIWDEDNGFLSIRSVAVDYENDAVTSRARELGILDYAVGWAGGSGPGTVADRNVVLWQKKP